MAQNQTDALGTAPVGSLFWKLSIPAITAQIINILYNLVDRIYIGHIAPVETVGRLALTGIGICLPVIVIITAFSNLFGYGSAPRAAIFLGKRDKAAAQQVLGNSCTALLVVATLITLILQFFAEPILLTFGASSETLPYALDYISIYSLGTVFVQLTLGLNPFITAQGFSKTSMLTVLIGAACNVILDPIFIFGLNMGVSGAALATILSQAISMIWILRFLTGKKATITLRFRDMKPKRSVLLASMALGLSPFIFSLTESLVTITFNRSLSIYGGDLAVGAMTILLSAMQFIMLPLSGMSQGSAPIISYNLGAANLDRVKEGFRYLIRVTFSFSCFMWLFYQLFAEFFVQVFNGDGELVAFAANALRIYMGAAFLLGLQVGCQQTFIALGDAKHSFILAILRKVILLIPLITILPNFFEDKTFAVFLAEPVSDVLACTCTVSLFFYHFRKIVNPKKPVSHP